MEPPFDTALDERLKQSARLAADLAAVAPELGAAAQRLFERVATPNWVLEWSLAPWLGETFRLAVDMRRELQACQLCLLAFARIADDLMDGEAPRSSLRLAAALQSMTTRRFAGLFDRGRPFAAAGDVSCARTGVPERFWRSFDEHVTEWFAASLGAGPACGLRSYGREGFQWVANRGALNKIVCAAACLLAGREADLAPLASLIDDIMIAVVMLDDEFDWADDLQAGRHNTFLAYCSELPQVPENRAAIRLAVLAEIYLGARARPFFAVIRGRLQGALPMAQAIGCRGLVDFIVWFDREVEACGTWLAQEAVRDASIRLTSPVDACGPRAN
jgi:hypothetical protein